ncbi:MAG TPA: hypothetical protein VMB26_17505 [Candidatus Binataceae bacterium]|nr:hypothetical protein [Candidatus Binataceae bacterium]
MKAWTEGILLWVTLSVMAMIVGCVMGCSSDSGSSGSAHIPTPTATATPFAGINQTYILQGGVRQLALNGLTGIYQATTSSGVNQLPVTLTSRQITVGGLLLPYLATANLFQASGFLGIASSAVSKDPTQFPATYNTLSGANFAGQLTIAASGAYSWCRASALVSDSACADGSIPQSGQIVVKSNGFAFGGLPGTYAAYHQATASALFPVDDRGLALRAMSQTRAQLSGTFSETLLAAAASNYVTTVTLTSNMITIARVPNFSGSYSYNSSGLGAFSFASSFCRNGTCPGIFNDVLGVMYIAQVGNGVFIQH